MKKTLLGLGLGMMTTAFSFSAMAQNYLYECEYENGYTCYVEGEACFGGPFKSFCETDQDPVEIFCEGPSQQEPATTSTFELFDDDAAISDEEDRISVFAIGDELESEQDKVAALTIHEIDVDKNNGHPSTLLFSEHSPFATRLEGSCDLTIEVIEVP